MPALESPPGLAMTVPQLLGKLQRRALKLEPGGPILDWGRRALDLSPREERAWFGRAWWSLMAWRVVREALQQGRIDEVMSLIDPPDTGPLERLLEAGRGALLASAHLGPFSVTRFVFSGLPFSTMVLEGRPWSAGLNLKTIDLSQEEDRKLALAKCLMHLRSNGVVLVAADGRSGEGFCERAFLNHRITMNGRAAQIVDLGQAPTLWQLTLWDWDRMRIRVLIEDSGLKPGGRGEVWEDVWTDAYLRRLEQVLRDQPENLSFAGGLWDMSRGGFSPLP